MNKEVQTQTSWSAQIVLDDLHNTHKMCNALMTTPHYAKIGGPGIFAIVQKAQALSMNPIDALNGGLYCINGKVEMSSNMMIQLIRQGGHSVTKDKRSNDEICILHGKRKDNGDTWTESFSIPDAQRAGIYKNVWEKFPRNMLFARALSNLARQLFPDAVKGCYVEGETSSLHLPVEEKEAAPIEPETIGEEKAASLEERFSKFPELRTLVFDFLEKQCNVYDLKDMPVEMLAKIELRLETEEKKEAPVEIEITASVFENMEDE